MRSNKGITLTSLIVYVIVFCIVLGTMSMFTKYFNKNVGELTNTSKTTEQYTRFTTYLTDDINSKNRKEISVKGEDIINIEFLDGSSHLYVYSNNKLYYISQYEGEINKEITICNNVKNFKVLYEEDQLKIRMVIDEITYNNNYSI